VPAKAAPRRDPDPDEAARAAAKLAPVAAEIMDNQFLPGVA